MVCLLAQREFFLSVFLGLNILLLNVCSHMLMSFPLSRGYVNNTKYLDIDYDLLSPLPNNKMCKGKPPGLSVATFSPGDVVNVSFHGSARHGGGICQFALSYDSDKSFFVIAEYMYGCPDSNYTWPVKIPLDAPGCSNCTFAWTWVNAIGNREYYMNCADITIQSNVSSVKPPGATHCGSPLKVFNSPGFPTLQPPSGSGGPTNSTYIPVAFSCNNQSNTAA